MTTTYKPGDVVLARAEVTQNSKGDLWVEFADGECCLLELVPPTCTLAAHQALVESLIMAKAHCEGRKGSPRFVETMGAINAALAGVGK